MQYGTAIRIALLAYVVSFAFSYVLLPRISDEQNVNPDPDLFGSVAQNIAAGNGFVYEKGGKPVLERPPLYAYLIAGVFFIANGYSLAAVQTLQAMIHAVTSFVLFVIVARNFNHRAGVIAQAIVALHPIVLWYTGRIWVETMFALLVLVVGGASILLFEVPTRKRAAGVGVAIGLSCLAKPILLFFPLVLAVALAFRFRSKGMLAGLVLCVAALAVVLPWTLRNYDVSGHVIPVSTSLGFNLVQGDVIAQEWPAPNRWLLDYWHAGWRQADSLLAPHNMQWERAEGDRLLTRHVLAGLAHSPGTALKRFAKNFCTFLFLSESRWKSVLVGFLQISLLLWAAVSYFLSDKALRQKLFPIVLLAGYFTLVHVVVVGWGRYSMPLVPLLIIPAVQLLGGKLQRT